MENKDWIYKENSQNDPLLMVGIELKNLPVKDKG